MRHSIKHQFVHAGEIQKRGPWDSSAPADGHRQLDEAAKRLSSDPEVRRRLALTLAK